MAERKISGVDKLLFIDPAGGTDYSLVVCLTSQSLERTTNTIDAASKCGPDKLAGSQEITVNFEGQEVVSPDVNRVSEGDLHDLWADKTVIGWKYGVATPTDGDVSYVGTGFISDLSSDSGMDDPSTFTATIGVKGAITKIVEGS